MKNEEIEEGKNTKIKRKSHDLSSLWWIDVSLTDEFDEGFQSIFKLSDIKLCSPNGNFAAVKEFKFPLVLGMDDGNMMILWFEFEWERNDIYKAL